MHASWWIIIIAVVLVCCVIDFDRVYTRVLLSADQISANAADLPRAVGNWCKNHLSCFVPDCYCTYPATDKQRSTNVAGTNYSLF